MKTKIASLSVFFFLGACSSSPPPPARPPMQTEKVEPLPPAEKKSVRLQIGGLATFVVAPVGATTDDPSIVRLYGHPAKVLVVGRTVGKTTVHVQTKKEVIDVDVEVVSGEATPRALAIGETYPLSMKGVKEYSVGLPGIVTIGMTTDGTQLLVTGIKEGTTTILLIGKDGKNKSHELVVVGGERYF